MTEIYLACADTAVFARNILSSVLGRAERTNCDTALLDIDGPSWAVRERVVGVINTDDRIQDNHAAAMDFYTAAAELSRTEIDKPCDKMFFEHVNPQSARAIT